MNYPAEYCTNLGSEKSSDKQSTFLQRFFGGANLKSDEKATFNFLFFSFFRIFSHASFHWIQLVERRSEPCLKSSGDEWKVGIIDSG